MQSKIDVDPLLVALFDIPACVQVQPSSSNKRDGQLPLASSAATGRRLHQTDDGIETDTSLLHGESISLTDEEYSDAVLNVSPPPGRVNRTTNFTSFRPYGVALPVRLPSGQQSANYLVHGSSSGLSGRTSPPIIPVRASSFPDEFEVNGGRAGTSSSLGIHFSENHTTILDSSSNRSSTNQASPTKKKKKRRSGAIKSLKKLVGRKSKSSPSASLTMSSSFDDADSIISSSTTDQTSYVGDNEQSPPNVPQNVVDENLSIERLSNLKSKIGTIRSTIHSLEGDLIATRNELSRAYQHLHFATMELADIQRAALEADIGLSKLVSMSPFASSTRLSPLHFFEADMSIRSYNRSSSSERLHYFTPTSSVLESGDDNSDCFTPRSRTSSRDSYLSTPHEGSINSPILDETTRGDVDKTPLIRNSKHSKQRRRFKFESAGVRANALAYSSVDSNKESTFVGTPNTAASSTQGEDASVTEAIGNVEKESNSEKKDSGRRVTFCRLQSFIRAHDLELSDEPCDNTSLLPLHETHANVGNVVDALFERGIELAMDESDRWSAESSTGKILAKRAKKQIDGPIGNWPNAALGEDVLVWTCKCLHDGHGSEYPVVKARGLIPTSAKAMVDLLLDSDRVKEYNKMSLGRVDEHCFVAAEGGLDKLTKCSVTGIQGELKIVRSQSQPPVVRKPVELRLLLHARRLPLEDGEEGSKYLTIGRSVWETEHGTAEAENNSATRCEMLLSVNLIRDLPMSEGDEWCEITTITHGVSPGIPISIGKRIGLAAAAKYIRDIRAVFEKQDN